MYIKGMEVTNNMKAGNMKEHVYQTMVEAQREVANKRKGEWMAVRGPDGWWRCVPYAQDCSICRSRHGREIQHPCE